MAIVTVPGGLWLWAPLIASPSFDGFVIDATAEKVAFVFRVPRTGTLNTCEFRVNTVANNPDNGLRISFQDLDASGDPDGTQDQFRTIAGPFVAATWITPGLITSDGTDGGTKRAVTAGARLAVVIEFESFVAADSIGLSGLNQPVTNIDNLYPLEHYIDHFTAAWAKSLSSGTIALEYATDGYVPIGDPWLPILSTAQPGFASNSTPDERALRFRVPVACQCDGAWIRIDLDGDADVVLYDSDGTTALATSSLDSSARFANGQMNVFVRWAPVSLVANTTYRLSVKPTTTTAVATQEMTLDSSGLMAAAVGGAEWYLSTRVDAGAWTEDATTRPWIGVHLNAIDDGGAGNAFMVSVQSANIILPHGVVGY